MGTDRSRPSTTHAPAGDAKTASAPPAEARIPDWVRFFPLFPKLEERVLTPDDDAGAKDH